MLTVSAVTDICSFVVCPRALTLAYVDVNLEADKDTEVIEVKDTEVMEVLAPRPGPDHSQQRGIFSSRGQNSTKQLITPLYDGR